MRRLLLIAVLGLVLRPAASPAAGIVYPALGNLELEEGSIEVWFTPMTELYPDVSPEAKYRGIFHLFGLEGFEDFRLGCMWYARPRRRGLKVSMGSSLVPKGLTAVLSKTPDDWRPGETHHAAFTWNGRMTRLYADGRQIGSKRQAIGLSGRTGNGRLVIGDPRHDAKIIVHAVRVSLTERTAAELAAAQPAADLATLLVDRYDDPEATERGSTRAAVIAGLDGATGGELLGNPRFVRKPNPGLALY